MVRERIEISSGDLSELQRRRSLLRKADYLHTSQSVLCRPPTHFNSGHHFIRHSRHCKMANNHQISKLSHRKKTEVREATNATTNQKREQGLRSKTKDISSVLKKLVSDICMSFLDNAKMHISKQILNGLATG